MKQIPNDSPVQANAETGMTQRWKSADVVYQVATVAAALLLLLTAAV